MSARQGYCEVGLLEDEGKSRLSRLFSVLEEAIVHRGFPPEPLPFSPHLTMARARDRLSSVDRSRIGRALQELRRSANLPGVDRRPPDYRDGKLPRLPPGHGTRQS